MSTEDNAVVQCTMEKSLEELAEMINIEKKSWQLKREIERRRKESQDSPGIEEKIELLISVFDKFAKAIEKNDVAMFASVFEGDKDNLFEGISSEYVESCFVFKGEKWQDRQRCAVALFKTICYKFMEKNMQLLCNVKKYFK